MTITESRGEDSLQLFIEGRIDISTAPQLQNSILTAFQKSKNVILDFKCVEYISSAGLRALLIGQKTAISKGGTMKLIHVETAVMQVLTVSGFSGMLNIE